MSTAAGVSPYTIAPSSEKPLRRGLDLAGSLRWPAFVASVLLLVSVGAALAQPVLVSRVVDLGVLPKDMAALRSNLILLLGVVIAEGLLTGGQGLLFAWVSERYLALLRSRIFEHLTTLSLRFFDANTTGDLIARAGDDVQALSAFVRRGLSNFLTGSLFLVLGIVVMGSLSLPLLAVCLIAVPLLRWLSRPFLRNAEPAQRTNRERHAATLDVIEQGLTGARLLHLFRRQRAWADSVDRHLDHQVESRMRVVAVNNRYFPWLEFTWILVEAAIIGVGAWLHSAELVTIGVISAFVLSLTRIFGPLEDFGYLVGQAQSAKASLGRIFALLDVPQQVPESPDAKDLPDAGNLDATNISFAYVAGAPVLKDINLRIEPGQTLALVGETGAGKSTLARLLARLYDPDQGRVTFAGLDLKEASQASIRSRIVLLPQEGHLFRGTVADNIRLPCPEASDAEVARVIRDLGLDERFNRFPQGLHTEVDERGTRLSAGERQLISLARVALINPEIAILDEALSNVDPGTEALVHKAMGQLMHDRTVIIIAHRESTARRADTVAWLADGVLAARGPHLELLQTNSLYAAFWGHARRTSQAATE